MDDWDEPDRRRREKRYHEDRYLRGEDAFDRRPLSTRRARSREPESDRPRVQRNFHSENDIAEAEAVVEGGRNERRYYGPPSVPIREPSFPRFDHFNEERHPFPSDEEGKRYSNPGRNSKPFRSSPPRVVFNYGAGPEHLEDQGQFRQRPTLSSRPRKRYSPAVRSDPIISPKNRGRFSPPPSPKLPTRAKPKDPWNTMRRSSSPGIPPPGIATRRRDTSLEKPLNVPGGFPYLPDEILPEDSRSETSPAHPGRRSWPPRPASATLSAPVSRPSSSSGILGDRFYRYSTLGDMEIRLIKILPAKMSTIKCEILHASLVKPPQYIAISYAWGDADDRRKIVLEGTTIPIAASLHGALDAIREKRDSVLVWVDALCIDQQNKDERTQQVQLMTDIYTKADSVAIWLGPEADDSNLAMKILGEVAANARSTERLTSIIANSYGKPDLGAVVSLFERDYWRRLWVVQEVFNAKDINVYCGSSVLHWSVYTEASHAFWRHRGVIDRYFPRGASQGKSQQVSMNQFTYSQVLGYQGPGSLPDVGSLTGLGEEALLEVMCACRRKLTFDARDKVFGIIGVLPQEVRNEFPVDYNLSVKEVYINVVDYILSTTERLDIICESIHFPLHTSSVNLPTFVPDWFHVPETAALGRSYVFKASGTTKAVTRFIDERRKLEISAIYVDTITTHGIAVGTLCTVSDYLMAFLHWRALLLGSYDAEDENDNHETQNAFCRTLSLDEVPAEWERSDLWLTACYHVFSSLIRERLPRLPLDRELRQYATADVGASVNIELEERRQFLQDHFGSRMMGRCFCLTESGYIGMGSGFMAAEDIIVVPLGCSTPIILRPQGSYGEYRFVGDVYIHTFMHGKAVEHLQAGKRQLEKFVIH